MSDHNTDDTIEVGDLVRVVAPRASVSSNCAGDEFIVKKTTPSFASGEDKRLYYYDELTVITPKAELESVYAEEKKLEEKKDKLYKLCDCFNTSAGFMSPYELAEGILDIMRGD